MFNTQNEINYIRIDGANNVIKNGDAHIDLPTEYTYHQIDISTNIAKENMYDLKLKEDGNTVWEFEDFVQMESFFSEFYAYPVNDNIYTVPLVTHAYTMNEERKLTKYGTAGIGTLKLHFKIKNTESPVMEVNAKVSAQSTRGNVLCTRKITIDFATAGTKTVGTKEFAEITQGDTQNLPRIIAMHIKSTDLNKVIIKSGTEEKFNYTIQQIENALAQAYPKPRVKQAGYTSIDFVGDGVFNTSLTSITPRMSMQYEVTKAGSFDTIVVYTGSPKSIAS